MERRALLTGAAGLFAAPLASGAQPAAKIARIGWLAINLATTPRVSADMAPVFQPFHQRLDGWKGSGIW